MRVAMERGVCYECKQPACINVIGRLQRVHAYAGSGVRVWVEHAAWWPLAQARPVVWALPLPCHWGSDCLCFVALQTQDRSARTCVWGARAVSYALLRAAAWAGCNRNPVGGGAGDDDGRRVAVAVIKGHHSHDLASRHGVALARRHLWHGVGDHEWAAGGEAHSGSRVDRPSMRVCTWAAPG